MIEKLQRLVMAVVPVAHRTEEAVRDVVSVLRHTEREKTEAAIAKHLRKRLIALGPLSHTDSQYLEDVLQEIETGDYRKDETK